MCADFPLHGPRPKRSSAFTRTLACSRADVAGPNG